MSSRKRERATAFHDYAVATTLAGVRIVRVITDNGACYRSKAFRDTVPASFCGKSRTRPCSPKDHGKAEGLSRPGLTEDNLLRLQN